jgi:hypothetical protein
MDECTAKTQLDLNKTVGLSQQLGKEENEQQRRWNNYQR